MPPFGDGIFAVISALSVLGRVPTLPSVGLLFESLALQIDQISCGKDGIETLIAFFGIYIMICLIYIYICVPFVLHVDE